MLDFAKGANATSLQSYCGCWCGEESWAGAKTDAFIIGPACFCYCPAESRDWGADFAFVPQP